MNEGHVLIAQIYALPVQSGGFRLTRRRPSPGTPDVWVIRVYGPPGSQYIMDSEFVPTLEGYKHLNQPHTATTKPLADNHDDDGPLGDELGAASRPKTAVRIAVAVLVLLAIVIIALVLMLGR
jgi:hypothetical protein